MGAPHARGDGWEWGEGAGGAAVGGERDVGRVDAERGGTEAGGA